MKNTKRTLLTLIEPIVTELEEILSPNFKLGSESTHPFDITIAGMRAEAVSEGEHYIHAFRDRMAEDGVDVVRIAVPVETSRQVIPPVEVILKQYGLASEGPLRFDFEASSGGGSFNDEPMVNTRPLVVQCSSDADWWDVQRQVREIVDELQQPSHGFYASYPCAQELEQLGR